MPALDLTSQFVREFAEQERELERLREAGAGSGPTSAELDEVRGERDRAQAELDAARASMEQEVRRLEAEVGRLSEESRAGRDRIRELESLLEKARAKPDVPEPSGLRERLAFAEYELELERDRSRKLYDENDQLRDELHRSQREMPPGI